MDRFYCEEYVMSPIVYVHEETDMGEAAIAAKHLITVNSRMDIPPNSVVVARYGLLPHYKEWERDLSRNGSRLLNSYAQHKFIADLVDWGGEYGVLKGLTPMAYTRRWDLLPEGSYVVKGRTNSFKQDWNSKMYAETKADVPRLAALINSDSILRDQGVVARPFVPLRKLDTGLNGLPISNEWRTFWIMGPNGPHLLAKGYYWQASHPESEALATWSREALELSWKAARLVGEHVNFFVIDVAETQTGEWIVIEVNDGQMSGLCGCDADNFYSTLAMVARYS